MHDDAFIFLIMMEDHSHLTLQLHYFIIKNMLAILFNRASLSPRLWSHLVLLLMATQLEKLVKKTISSHRFWKKKTRF